MTGHGQISVVVASRGRPEAIRRCLTTIVAAATEALGEIIVVDQSTPPYTGLAEIVAAAPEVRFQHLTSDTVGVSRGRNLGIEAATGEIIAFTDDDCMVDDNWIAAIATAFADDRTLDGLTGRVAAIGDGDPDIVPTPLVMATQPARFSPTGDPSAHGGAGNFAARRDALRAVGGFDESLGPGSTVPAAEDIDLLYRLVQSGHHLAFVPSVQISHESWRPVEELLALTWSYGFGSGVYLTRELIGRGDRVALNILLWRLLKGGCWSLLGGLLMGHRWHIHSSWRRICGTLYGAWCVLVRHPDYQMTDDWIAHPAPRRRAQAGGGVQ